jgi:hypothetical protein
MEGWGNEAVSRISGTALDQSGAVVPGVESSLDCVFPSEIYSGQRVDLQESGFRG